MQSLVRMPADRMEKRSRNPAARDAAHSAPKRMTQSASSLTALPTACLVSVLRHFVGGDASATALYPVPFPLAKWHRSLVVVALVSREWRAAVHLLTDHVAHGIARIDISAAVAQTPSSVHFSNVERRPNAADLRLVMQSVVTMADSITTTSEWCTIPIDYDDAVRLRNSHRVLRSMSSIRIDWPRLLTPRSSHLLRLDLSHTPLDCSQLGSVLHAASTCCPLVRVLALPKDTRARCSEDNEARETNLNELYGALQRWHRANGGLLHLRIPFGRFDENTAVRLLRSLAAYCPEIEYLDGWQDSYMLDDDGLASCEAYWPAPAPWWNEFWRKCTKLRAFNTVVMPFDDDYFVDFSPAVEALVLAIDSAKARHYEVSPIAMLAVATSVRNLQSIRLEIPFVRDDVWDPRACITDIFLRSLTLNAPHLREFRLQCADHRVLFNISALGVRQLAQLKNLQVVELQRLRVFKHGMVTELFRYGVHLELNISFAMGQDDMWTLLRMLADSCFLDDEPTRFSASLWCIGDSGSRDHGITKEELTMLSNRLVIENGRNVEVHVHTKQRVFSTANPAIMDLDHIEYRVHAPLAREVMSADDKSKTRGFAFPTCDKECLGQRVTEL